MNFCPQCRTQLDPGARFCANCGHTLPAQGPAGPPGGPRPFAGQPGYAPPQAPGYGPPPAQPGYAPPAQPGYAPPGAPAYGPPPAPPQYGAPPGQPPGYGVAPPGPPGYGAAPVGAMPPPPPEEGGGGLKILGGCGVAGCLGAGFAALMGVGLIVVLVMLSGSSSSGSSPSSGPGGEVPSSGSVRSLIRPQVGDYRLVGTSPLEKVPPGVVDSIGAVYTSPGGARIIHLLLVYPTDSIANDRIQNVWSTSISNLKPGQKVTRGNVTDSSGAVRGSVVAVTGANPESFYWNNRKLVVIVEGPAPHAKAFESSAPY